jgi:hypothetical protein
MEDKNILNHSGIKGQKWGIRRFQNEDGTLTDEGKKRYRELKKDVQDENSKQREMDIKYYKMQHPEDKSLKDYKLNKITAMTDEQIESEVRRRLEKEGMNYQNKLNKDILSGEQKLVTDVSNTVSALNNQIPKQPDKVRYGKYPHLTDAELQSRINRINLERKYSDVTGDTRYMKSSLSHAKSALSAVSNVTLAASAAIGTAVSWLTLKNMLSERKKLQQSGIIDEIEHLIHTGMDENTYDELSSSILVDDEYDEDDYDLFIEHHGIKGMRWGIRRFQNEDGTLTDEGKKHYGALNEHSDYKNNPQYIKDRAKLQRSIQKAKFKADLKEQNRRNKEALKFEIKSDKAHDKSDIQKAKALRNMERKATNSEIKTEENASRKKIKSIIIGGVALITAGAVAYNIYKGRQNNIAETMKKNINSDDATKLADKGRKKTDALMKYISDVPLNNYGSNVPNVEGDKLLRNTGTGKFASPYGKIVGAGNLTSSSNGSKVLNYEAIKKALKKSI